MESANQNVSIAPTETSQIPNTISPNQPKRLVKVIAIIIILIFIGIGIGTLVLVTNKKHFSTLYNQHIKDSKLISPTTNPTTSWKTYTSQQGNFSFAYPFFYVLHINELSGFETSFKPTQNALELEDISNKMNEKITNFPYDIKITFKIVNPNETIGALSQKDNICVPVPTTKQMQVQPIPIINREQVVVDTGQAIICDAESAGGYDTDVYILNKNIVYNINIPSVTDRSFVKTFLSTFKFSN